MASQFNDILSDFDLNFFHQTPNNSVINNNIEKQQRAILIAKKKIVATNALVKKFYVKKEALDLTEKTLFASKEECKQIYIDYTNLIEKCTHMENETQILLKDNHELQAKCIALENSYAALQSHTNQLQVLIKEHETVIESIKIETKLEKCGAKEYERKINILKKKNDVLMEHICLARDVVLGKKKLSQQLKSLLQKYKKKKKSKDNGIGVVEQENSCDEMDNIDSPSMSPFFTEDSCDKRQDSPLMNINTENSQLTQLNENNDKNLTDRNDGYLSTRNEVISVDTGRGSSLAFSDSDKSFHSPEYSISDNIFSTESCIHKENPKVDRALSPIIFEDSEFIPIYAKECKDVATSPLHFISNNDMPQVVIDPKEMVRKALSPIPLIEKINVSTSSTRCQNEVIDNIQNDYCKELLSEKECLEINSSNNTCYNNIADFEIERILDTMRLSYDILSPISTTPIEFFNAEEIHSLHALNKFSEKNSGYVCKDAAQLREENKVLQTSIADLTKEVINIKYLLKRKSIITDDFQNEESLTNEHQYCRNKPVSYAFDDNTYNIDRNNSINSNIHADSSSTPKLSDNLLSDGSFVSLNKKQELLKYINEIEVMDTREEVNNSETVTSDIISLGYVHPNQSPWVSEVTEKQQSSLHLHGQKIGIVRKDVDDSDIVTTDTISLGYVHPNQSFCVSEVTEKQQSSMHLHGQKIGIVRKDVDDSDVVTTDTISLGYVHPNQSSCVSEVTEKQQSSMHLHSQKIGIVRKDVDDSDVVTTDTILLGYVHPNQSPCVSEVTEKQQSLMHLHGQKIGIVRKDVDDSDVLTTDTISLGYVHPNQSSCVSEVTEKQQSSMHLHGQKIGIVRKDVDDSDIVITDTISFHHVQQNKPYVEEVLEKQGFSIHQSQKIGKVRNLTKLQRLRKQLIPKNNIKRDMPPKRKRSHVLLKPLNFKKAIKDTDSSVLLNDKDVYEKARKVMAELKSQQKSIKCTNNLNVNSIRKLLTSRSVSYENKSPKSSNENQDENCTTSHEQKSIASKNSTEKSLTYSDSIINHISTSPVVLINKILSPNSKNARKRELLDKPQVESKRVLRSSSIRKSSNDDHSIIANKNKCLSTNSANDTYEYDNTTQKPLSSDNDVTLTVVTNDVKDTCEKNGNLPDSKPVNVVQTNSIQEDLTVVPQDGFIETDLQSTQRNDKHHNNITDYSDLDMFTENILSIQHQFEENKAKILDPKESILCLILEKYGKRSIRVCPKKRADVSVVCQEIEEGIKEIMELPSSEMNDGMNKLVDNIQKRSYKSFLAGLIQYLKNPERKIESFNKVSSPPAPPMTKPEQILLYVVTRLKACWHFVDIVNQIFLNIEYTLFKLNDTPTFDIIETMSHFYAVLCRYFKAKTRLRLFVLDAMYCIQFKALPLIKQCLDVWMHILPLAHMGIAKTPLVTCLVYLLHFYKCEDKFRRVQDIRNILNKKYSYQMADWNDKKLLEMCRNAIKELKDKSLEKKTLRMTLIILAKRRGPRWCQDRIIKNILQPMIENENVPDRIKQFCVSIFGPLLKPYPVEMKIHCEIIINQLFNMLQQNPSAKMEEAIFTSLIYMSKHNHNRVIQALLSWKPRHISYELEILLRDFVAEKSAKTWEHILSKISFDE